MGKHICSTIQANCQHFANHSLNFSLNQQIHHFNENLTRHGDSIKYVNFCFVTKAIEADQKKNKSY